MYDVAKIRKDFPILDREVHGVPLVYLDNAATSQKPRAVIQALSDYYERYNANVHRGAHTLAIEATDAYEEARAKVARFINAPSPENIVFVRNTTEAINLVAHTWAVANVGAGDRIVVTEMEHHSNLVPWQHVARVGGAELKLMAMTSGYELDTSDLDELLTPATKLVALTHMSNVLGTITPVAEVVAAAHRVGALALIDAAQSVPHMPVDVQALDCDFMAFSGHKMLGPTGIGVLYAKADVLEEMDPFLRGGEMVLEVTYEDATWNQVPLKFEAGTPNIGDAIALGAAVDYLSALGMESVREHEVALTGYAMERFAELEEVTTFGPSDLSVR
ncbi:MAG: SufS family cysteine desulfurase, partial [Chloroflexi bacterium]|nr:SufS family cysteine desulfurase [Chloroflexota bacterium]